MLEAEVDYFSSWLMFAFPLLVFPFRCLS